MPYLKPEDMPSFKDKSNPAPHSRNITVTNLDKAFKRAELDEKWNTNPRTKLSKEELENLRAMIKDPNYVADGTISPEELQKAEKKLRKIAEGKDEGLNAWNPEDHKKIISATKELHRLEELEKQGK